MIVGILDYSKIDPLSTKNNMNVSPHTKNSTVFKGEFKNVANSKENNKLC